MRVFTLNQGGDGMKQRYSEGMMRIMSRAILGLSLLLTLTTVSSTSAKSLDPYQISSLGDQSTVQIQVKNFGSSERRFKIGPQTGILIEREISAYGAHEYLLQCLKRNDVQSSPKLSFILGEQEAKLYDWVTRSEDPKKVIWNRGSLQSSNQLKWSLRKTLEGLYKRPVRSVRTDTFVTQLSAWARTEIFLTSLKALGDLSDQQLFILKMMVTSGMTLVIGTGDMEGDEKLIQRFTPVSLGQVKTTSGALLEQLPRVSSYRRLFPRGAVAPIVVADGETIAVESHLGLGRVRVLAVRLNEITKGETAKRILSSDWSARGQLEEWLDLTMPPLTESPRLLNDNVWLMLFLIPLFFRYASGRWRMIAGGTLVWIMISLLRPPLFVPTSVSRAHLLYLPMDEGAMILSQVDLNSFDRGGRAEPIKAEQIALVSAETEGACLIHDLTEPLESRSRESGSSVSTLQTRGWWVIESDLGERQRFKYIAFAPRIPRPHLVIDDDMISEWPPGPWSGAVIEALAPLETDLPIPVDLKGVKAWRLPMQSPKEIEPPLVYHQQPMRDEE